MFPYLFGHIPIELVVATIELAQLVHRPINLILRKAGFFIEFDLIEFG
jgi:hypothetical protein